MAFKESVSNVKIWGNTAKTLQLQSNFLPTWGIHTRGKVNLQRTCALLKSLRHWLGHQKGHTCYTKAEVSNLWKTAPSGLPGTPIGLPPPLQPGAQALGFNPMLQAHPEKWVPPPHHSPQQQRSCGYDRQQHPLPISWLLQAMPRCRPSPRPSTGRVPDSTSSSSTQHSPCPEATRSHNYEPRGIAKLSWKSRVGKCL